MKSDWGKMRHVDGKNILNLTVTIMGALCGTKRCHSGMSVVIKTKGDAVEYCTCPFFGLAVHVCWCFIISFHRLISYISLKSWYSVHYICIYICLLHCLYLYWFVNAKACKGILPKQTKKPLYVKYNSQLCAYRKTDRRIRETCFVFFSWWVKSRTDFFLSKQQNTGTASCLKPQYFVEIRLSILFSKHSSIHHSTKLKRKLPLCLTMTVRD